MPSKIFYSLTAFSFSILAAVLFLVFTPNINNEPPVEMVANAIKIEGDMQIINITAKGGYYPNSISAKAGMQTLLKVTTNNTYDCSSALYIPDIKYSKSLPVNGITEIQIPKQSKGEKITGLCSMGMYRFTINFN